MKHGLKQEIKRGLSVLMAVSMVASSALPVMAEEVVEEAVEVEVVSEEVADEAGDVVVDVADVEDVEEEVVEDVVVEEAADAYVNDEDKDVKHENHTFDSIVALNLYDNTGNDGKKDQFIVTWKCTGCDVLQYSDAVNLPLNGYPFGVGGGSLGADYATITLGGQTVHVLKSVRYHKDMNCDANIAGEDVYYVYKDGAVADYKDDKTNSVYAEATVPVAHTPGTAIVTKIATCTTTGERSYTCTKCNKVIQNEVIAMKPHNWVPGTVNWSDDASSAYITFTCTETKDKDGKDVKETKVVDLTPYIYLKEGSSDTTLSTCETTGSAKYGISITASQLKEALGLRTTPADKVNGSTGVDTTVATLNASTKTVNLKVKGHNITAVKFTFDTEANDYGAKAGANGAKCELTCSRCGVITVRATSDGSYKAVLPAQPGNDWPISTLYKANSWKVEKDEDTSVKATCTETGVDYYHAVFTFDGKKYDSKDYIAEPSKTVSTVADAHSYANGNAKVEDAMEGTVTGKVDCTSSTAKGTFKCKYCGKVESNVNIPKLGHDLVIETTNLKAPTCDTYGVYNAHCSRCEKTLGNGITVTAPAAGSGVNGTITSSELTTEQKKALLNKNTAHKYVINPGQKPVWTADNTYCKISVKCDCGSASHASIKVTETKEQFENAIVKNVKAVEVIDKEATVKEKGSKHYEATLKFTDDYGKEWVFTEKSVSMEIPAKGGQEKATVSITGKTVTYNGDRQHIVATTNSDVKPVVSYYRDAALTEKFSGAPYTAGTYYVKATVAASKDYTAAESEVVKLVIEKADPKVTISWKPDKDDATKANITVK